MGCLAGLLRRGCPRAPALLSTNKVFPLSHRETRLEGDELSAGPRSGLARLEAVSRVRPHLTELPLWRQVVVLAVWPLMEQFLSFMVGFVDAAIAGRLSVASINAIGVAAYVGWLIGLVQSSLGIGSTALIARMIGARRRRPAETVLGQSMFLAPLAGGAIGLLVFALAPQIAGFAKLPPDSLTACVSYLRIITLAAPLGAMLFVGSACLRGAGDTRTPFFILLIVNAVNIGLSWLLTMGPAPFGGRGVRGIAIGTAVAWLVGAMLIMAVLLSRRGVLRLRLRFMRPHTRRIWRILRVALPNMAESLLAMWVANFVLIRVVGMLGTEWAWGAHLIAIRIEALSYMPGFALGIAAATLAGQHLGAGSPAGARRAIIACWAIGAGIMTVMGLMFIFLPEPLVRIITDKPELLANAPPLLRICGFVQVFFGSAIVLGQGMRGAGDTRTPLMMTAASTYLVRVPLAYFFGVHLGWGLIGVWYGLCIELTVRGLIFSFRFLQGGWARTRV